jgi:hypothetical protein
MKTMIKGTALAIALALSAGCAQNSSMQTSVDDLTSRVDALEASLASANNSAAAAQSTADAAARAAQQSQDCCDATNEKIDRMFEASQSK